MLVNALLKVVAQCSHVVPMIHKSRVSILLLHFYSRREACILLGWCLNIKDSIDYFKHVLNVTDTVIAGHACYLEFFSLHGDTPFQKSEKSNTYPLSALYSSIDSNSQYYRLKVEACVSYITLQYGVIYQSCSHVAAQSYSWELVRSWKPSTCINWSRMLSVPGPIRLYTAINCRSQISFYMLATDKRLLCGRTRENSDVNRMNVMVGCTSSDTELCL